MRRFNIAIGSLLALFFVPLFASAFTFNNDLALGDTSSDVSMLQIVLEKEGFFVHEITEYFGPVTQAAVQAFQSAKGITPVSGIVGPKTRAVLNGMSPQTLTPALTPVDTTFVRDLDIGSEGADVLKLQEFLVSHSNGPAVLALKNHGLTTFFGLLTQAALAEYQASVGITPAAGYFGPLTRTYISSLLSPMVSDDNPSPFSNGGVTRRQGNRPSQGDEEDNQNGEDEIEEDPGDTTDPEISDIDVADVTDDSATFTWTTDEPADSQVLYGVTSGLGEESTLDTEATTTHTVILTGLDPDTTYFFSVRSEDAAGNSEASDAAVFSTYTAEAFSFFDRLATEPDTEHKNAYDELISDLIYADIWDKLDALYILAAEDEDTAKTNLVSSSYGLSEVGTLSFSADGGYSGANGISSYLESGFDPNVGTPHFARNSNSLFAWKNTNPAGDEGMLAALSDENSYLQTYRSDGRFYYAANGGSHSIANFASRTGLFEAMRLDSSTMRGYVDGVLHTSTVSTGSVLASGKTMRFVGDGLNYGTTAQVAMGGFGGAFTSPDSRNIYTIFYNYLADINDTTPTLLDFGTDIINDGAGNYTPGIARLADGRLLAVYCVGNSQADGKIVYQTSDDDGRTWSSATDLATPPAGSTYTDTSVTVLSDGQIFIPFMREPNTFATSTVHLIKGIVEENSSFTWSAPIDVPSELSIGPATSSYVLELQDGRLMLGLYIWPQAIVSVVFSSDGGDTWGDEVTVVDGQSDDFTESNYVQLENGTLIGVLRDDHSTPAFTGYYVVSSTDNGATWSVPVQIFDDTVAGAPGRPALSIAPDGTLFLLSRFNGSASPQNATGFTYSFDEGVTWSTPEIYFNANNLSYGQHTYAQGFYDDVTDTFMYILAQGGYTTAQVNFQRFDVPTP